MPLNEAINGKLSVETQIMLIEQKQTFQSELLGKIVEIQESIRDLLHSHDGRLNLFESQELAKRVTALERYKWIMVGAVAIGGALASFFGSVALHNLHISIIPG